MKKLFYSLVVLMLAAACGQDTMTVKGTIAEGKLADALLIDLDRPCMVGDYSLVSNLVYSADPSVIDTVICDGEILMRGGVIPGEAEIVAAARETCDKFRRDAGGSAG